MKAVFLCALSSFVLFSCNSNRLDIPGTPAIYDLASPVRVQSDTTWVYLTDYVLSPEKIKRITPPESMRMQLQEDKKSLYLLSSPDTKPIENISFKYKGHAYDVPVLGKMLPEAGDGALQIATDELRGDTIFLRCSRPVEYWAVYFQNAKLKDIYVQPMGSRVAIIIPEEATELRRGKMRVWATDGGGVSNDILIPLENGRVVTEAASLDRFDKRASTLYFLMVDRFYDAEKENNHPLNLPDVLPIADYMGGDIVGVTHKLREGYFERMGINTIWLSPVMKNPLRAYGEWKNPYTKFSGYHGYWPESSSGVDYRYGTPEELRELIDEAHQRNMNVIMDYVANYVHEEHPLYHQHKDWATSLYLPDGTLNVGRWDDHRLTTWFDTFLPTLDLERKDVCESMSDSALYWIKEYNLDGFRYNATRHVPHVFWRALTQKLKKDVMLPHKETVYQVGEAYGSRELAASYVGSGQMDGQLDLHLYDDAVPVFALPDQSFKRLNNSLLESFRYNGVHNMMTYISGDQARARFISYAAGDIRLDEDSKAAGWSRKIGGQKPSTSAAYGKLLQLLAFNATIPGIPAIYYGDEIGMTGANVPDNHQMMRFDNLSENEQMIWDKSAALNNLRRNSMALIYGDFIPLRVEDHIYAYARSYFGKEVVVVFNKGRELVTLKLDLPAVQAGTMFKPLFGGRFSYDKSSLILDVPAGGVEVIYN